MKDKIIKIFSSSGFPILIGVVGFSSSLVTMFINVNDLLSIKWLIFCIVISTTVILILLKVIYDLSQETKPSQPFEHPIRYLPDDQIFVIKKNDNFLNSIVVGCYAQQDEIDRLAYLGVVHHVQDTVIQIKILFDFGVFEKMLFTSEQLKNIAVRPVVPVTALAQFSNLEN